MKILIFILLLLPLTITAAPTPTTAVAPKVFTDLSGNVIKRTYWNANTSKTDGYFYYCSPTVGDFKTAPLDVPGMSANTIQLSTLPCLSEPNGDYFFTVTAYYDDPVDGKRKESGAEKWIPVKVTGGETPIDGIPVVPGGLKVK